MSTKILVVEDVQAIYEYYLRVFEQILPMADLEFTHAGSIQAACAVLENPFDIILMDYSLGAPFLAPGATKPIRNGAELIQVRLLLERRGVVRQALFFGTSSSKIGNDLLTRAGAHYIFHKTRVEELANALKTTYKNLKESEA